MTIARTAMEDTWDATCDACSHYEEVEAEGFVKAVGQIRESGWKTTRAGAEWVHLCPSCVEDV